MTPYTLSYKLRSTGVLRIRLRWFGRELMVSPGIKVDREKWDGNRAKPGTTHTPKRIPAGTINATLRIWEERIDKAFFDLTGTPSPAEVKAAIMGTETPKPTETIETIYNRYVLERSSERGWSLNTVKSVRSFGNLLLKYNPRLNPREITPDTMADFVRWQHTARLSDRNEASGMPGYSNAVIRKNCRMFRWFMSWLTEQGKLPPETTRLSKATVKTLRKPVIYLTRAELDTLEGYPFPIGSDEDRARDFFVFCAYSSLRYSDASRLMKSMVSQTHIEINAEKTGTLLRIDLNSHTRRILEKYSQSPSPLALPRITVARLNVLIKKIGQTCGFDSPVTVEQYYGSQRKARTLPKWELLSSHAARRTFVVTALSRGIAPNIVMKWTGHSDYQAMLPYIDIADREKANAMALMD